MSPSSELEIRFPDFIFLPRVYILVITNSFYVLLNFIKIKKKTSDCSKSHQRLTPLSFKLSVCQVGNDSTLWSVDDQARQLPGGMCHSRCLPEKLLRLLILMHSLCLLYHLFIHR